MKRRILGASLSDSAGSWLLTRSGKLIETALHVPSTTYESHGLFHLSPTDAQFLYNHGRIKEDDVKVITAYCFKEYLDLHQIRKPSMIDKIKFGSFADLQYATVAQKCLNTVPTDSLDAVKDASEGFDSLNNRYYDMLCNRYVKVSKFGRNIEIRITSKDGFDWNDIIIDDFILKNEQYLRNCSFTIMHEQPDGKFKSYFMSASLNDILEADKMVLSSETYNRVEDDTTVQYLREPYIQ